MVTGLMLQAGGIKTARRGTTIKGEFQGVERAAWLDAHILSYPSVQPTSLIWLVAGRKEVFSCSETSVDYVV